MASNFDNFTLKKSNGWMNYDNMINYKSQKPLNNNFYTYQSVKRKRNIRFCLVKDDVLNLDVSCIVHFYQQGGTSNGDIFKKAGKLYENEFNSKLLQNLANLSNNHSLFITLSGEMVNCEYILNFIYKLKHFPTDIREKEILRTIYESYASIFEATNRLNIKSLAVPFLIIENEIEMSVKAIIESLIHFTDSLENKGQSLKLVYLTSDNDEILKKFDNLATYGYNLDYIIYKSSESNQHLSEYNNQENKIVFLKKTKNFQDFYNICDICGKNSLLISNFLNDDYLKNCSKNRCKMCITGFKIASFFQSRMFANCDKFCIYCVGDFVSKIKYSLCSSCLRNIDKTKFAKNKYCNKDSLCLKCENLPKNVSKYCYVCEFYIFLQKLDEIKMILNHESISCCFDYCNLSEIEYEDISKLSCGHTSCSKIENFTKLCSLCAIDKFLMRLKEIDSTAPQ